MAGGAIGRVFGFPNLGLGGKNRPPAGDSDGFPGPEGGHEQSYRWDDPKNAHEDDGSVDWQTAQELIKTRKRVHRLASSLRNLWTLKIMIGMVRMIKRTAMAVDCPVFVTINLNIRLAITSVS